MLKRKGQILETHSGIQAEKNLQANQKLSMTMFLKPRDPRSSFPRVGTRKTLKSGLSS